MYCLSGFFVYSWEFQNSYTKTVKGPYRSFQTVDKALLLQGFAIVGTAFLI